VIDRSKFKGTENVKNGAYVLAYGDESSTEKCEVILIATGSEVHLALAAREQMLTIGIKARVVSAPCLEWFLQQPISYQEQVLPKKIRARVSIEAGIAQCWYRFIGDAGVPVSLEHFGASAGGSVLFKEFGFTVEKVVSAARESISKANA
jgi:transketolase